jgi:hypothetical protein
MGRLASLVEALPELPDELQGALALRVPGLLDTPALEVRAHAWVCMARCWWCVCCAQAQSVCWLFELDPATFAQRHT